MCVCGQVIEVWRLAFFYVLSEEEGNKFKYQNKCWLKVLLSGPSQLPSVPASEAHPALSIQGCSVLSSTLQRAGQTVGDAHTDLGSKR